MDFTHEWVVLQTLGEGAYGEVKLLQNKYNGLYVAMKIINHAENPEGIKKNVFKETNIHKMANHDHVIKYYGQKTHETLPLTYIFLEYASGGELFDKIEPDIGMEAWEAQKYMKQLMSGVQFLHSKGIVHRDLKPENLLLDEEDNLKITDFGMAAVFRLGGKERMMQNRCGTTPYMAPEIFSRQTYRAEPVDIWACGIILVAMLAGELPWDKAKYGCREFDTWKNGNYMSVSPWAKLDNLAITLLRKILSPQPAMRMTVDKILQHRWCVKEHAQTKGPQTPSTQFTFKRTCSNEISPPALCNPRLCQSQFEVVNAADSPPGVANPAQMCFSQPAQINDLLVSTQSLATQSTQHQFDCMQKLVRRMTRFFVTVEPLVALERLQKTLDEMQLTHRPHTAGILNVSTVDKYKNQLTFKASLMMMNKQTLMDFRLSKGCGLEFKRQFLAIKKQLSDIVMKGPVAWPIAMATNVAMATNKAFATYNKENNISIANNGTVSDNAMATDTMATKNGTTDNTTGTNNAIATDNIVATDKAMENNIVMATNSAVATNNVMETNNTMVTTPTPLSHPSEL